MHHLNYHIICQHYLTKLILIVNIHYHSIINRYSFEKREKVLKFYVIYFVISAIHICFH